MNRRPFDPRLYRHIPAVRLPLAALGLTSALTALVIIGQATGLALLLAGAAQGRLDRTALAGLLAALTGRALLTWLQGMLTAHIAATVKATLRVELLGAIGRRGPAWLADQPAGQLATLTGPGLDALDDYLTGYLPQLVLGITVPLAVLARLLFADWSSALIIALTLPLIPIFGALVGWQARTATERQWRRLSLLGGHFLDMVTGLATLRAFGRARAQTGAVRQMADAHRRATMRTLRIAFLSGLVLELVATLSVALVAVPVGLRLLHGGLDLATALLILLLTPEAYLPLRAAGSRFHASLAGLTALDEAFTVIERTDGTAAAAGGAPEPTRSVTGRTPDPARSASRCVPDPARPGVAGPAEIRLEAVSVEYARGTALREVSLVIRPGERVAVIGPSGAGKSTLIGLLLGLVTPSRGRILVDGTDLADLDPERWRRQLAWVPQRAHLFAASLADNIRLGTPDAPMEAVAEAVRAAHLDEVVAGLPAGLDTRLGERGYGLSSGQRQRVALARAFLRQAPVVLLDEPTARLDGAAETAVLDATRRLLTGRTAVFVAHRPALLAEADRVVRIDGGRLTELTGWPGPADDLTAARELEPVPVLAERDPQDGPELPGPVCRVPAGHRPGQPETGLTAGGDPR